MRFTNRGALRKKRVVARQLRKRSTPEEKRLWGELRTNRLAGFHFRRQHVLAGFVVDFYCPKAHLVIELDGDHHRSQVAADRERQAVLEGLGNRVLRFPNAEIRENLTGVLARIQAEVIGRTRIAVPPSPLRGRGTGG